MPILLLFIIFGACFLIYYYVISNEDLYTRKKPDKKGPFDTIYLPEDLERDRIKRMKDEARRGRF
ncbi:MAG: hypothetical protein WCY49_02180 [Anaerovoracaceae bacterium]